MRIRPFLPLPVALLLSVSLVPRAGAQQTVPERTSYQRTSTTAEVGAFLDSLQARGAPITVGTMGTTAQGRPIYLVIASDPRVTSPREAARSGKLVVYVQANIHAGEVEGKEAVQQLLRELKDEHHDLLSKLVILVAPVYNADGNDAMGPVERNRGEQNGPPMVGLRYDGMQLDLNRDYLKAEGPETRASLTRVYDTWDPALMMDLHTTDGTLHGYLLTFSPGLNPNGPPGPTAFTQDTLLPAVRAAMHRKYQEPIFPYGNVRNAQDPQAWTTYSPLAWYGTNYVGMRGRIAILSEAYAHADFKTRIKATHDFVLEVLRYAADHADHIRELERLADRQTTLEGRGDLPRPELAVDFEAASRGVEPVVLRRNDRLDTVRLPVFDRFVGSRSATMPGGYLVPQGDGDIARLLRLHGIQVRRLEHDWKGDVQVMKIDSLNAATNEFQGHHLLTVRGTWSTVSLTVPAGTYYVSTAQPLGRLVFELLEPAGYGLASWNFFDRRLGTETGALAGLVYGSGPVRAFPVWRVDHDPRTPMRVLP